MRIRTAGLLALAAAALTLACGRTGNPLEKLIQSLDQLPAYSIILEDMRVEGNFFPSYEHQYKVVQGVQAEAGAPAANFESMTTDWERVSRRQYQSLEPYLGMVIASKSEDGQVQQGTGYPPGYQYVGNPQYGQWRQDASGNSFWEFAGKYAVLSALFNMANRPIYRNEWDSYRDYRSRGRPFFGSSRQFGTDGSYTKQTHPTFFQRRLQRERASQRRFSQRVRSRMSGTRSRSRGFGK